MSVSLKDPPKLAGKKRKRHMAVEEDTSVKLTGKLHQYLKDMRKAAKKSKAFEIQRLVKKLKGLRKPTHVARSGLGDIKDLEIQLETLKRTDHERIAHLALSSKIRKDKLLASNDTLMSSLASTRFTTTIGDAEASSHVKVESRLLSSKILAAEAQAAVKGLRTVLEPGMATTPPGDVTALEAHSHLEREDEENDQKVAVHARLRSKVIHGDGSDEDGTREAVTLEEVDEADDMIDGDGWESGSIDDGLEDMDSDDDEPNLPRKQPKASAPHLGILDPSSSAATSTFLPSLSVGYIKGGSDSDVEPSDGETAASGKKNRRGQRARQAIWEKKYGRNAKHVKKQREAVQATATARSLGKSIDQGWHGRRHGDDIRSVSIPGANKKRLAQTHSGGRLERHTPSEKPTHPSWEAKRKLKEKEGARILPSQGKKIVFT
ncbi:Bud-site selection protein [Gautieria morchelliformis]|nr:Bud-site selection protein [Gautieria morchelliformis]